ncbi:MAG: tetratricopeptide repeat protein [Flavobacteriales bacterium]|nr:tetratricopeptide repeat protein [Flavobacteriales bacterium]
MRCLSSCLIFLSVLTSCVDREKYDYRHIVKLESQLLEQQVLEYDSAYAEQLLQAYRIFLSSHPTSSKKTELLFKYAEVLKGQGSWLDAAEIFHQVHDLHPESSLAPLALFHQAHCFEMLQQKLTAKNTYQEFITRYPNHPYIEQAKGMIALLQYSDEELMQQFQE